MRKQFGIVSSQSSGQVRTRDIPLPKSCHQHAAGSTGYRVKKIEQFEKFKWGIARPPASLEFTIYDICFMNFGRGITGIGDKKTAGAVKLQPFGFQESPLRH